MEGSFGLRFLELTSRLPAYFTRGKILGYVNIAAPTLIEKKIELSWLKPVPWPGAYWAFAPNMGEIMFKKV